MSDFDSHSFYELYFLFEGKRTITFDDKIFNIEKNTLAIIPPFTPHQTAGGSYTRINVYVSPRLLLNDFKFIDNQQKKAFVYRLDESNAPIIQALLEKACELSLFKTENEFALKNSFLNTILFYLQQSNLQPHEYEQKTNFETDQLNALINYVNTHYNEKINLNFLCKKFYFAKSNLYRKFKASVGYSIGEYVLFLRLNHAKEMLFLTDESIEKISEKCGFSSLNYFSLIFKRKVGVAPTEFRKQR